LGRHAILQENPRRRIPEETKVILGWEIYSRTLRFRLPTEKLSSWTADIYQLLQLKTVTYDQLATTIGRLNPASYVIPTARACLCHLRRTERQARAIQKKVPIPDSARNELRQWIYFLQVAIKGISLNLLTLRVPSIILPTALRGGISLNLLEYIASVVTITIEAEANLLQPEACVLSQLDSSTSDYWLHQGGARFQGPEKTIHLEVSHCLATTLFRAKVCRYSQWIPGTDNIITDALSSDHHLADEPLGRFCQQAQDLEAAHLGHDPDAVGLHLIRSAAAMAMILSGVPNYMVMLIGQWKLDAFLMYVRKQVSRRIYQVSESKNDNHPHFFPSTREPRGTPQSCVHF